MLRQDHDKRTARPRTVTQTALPARGAGAFQLDNCGLGPSPKAISGSEPSEMIAVSAADASTAVDVLAASLRQGKFAVFTLAYDLGLALEPRLAGRLRNFAEPLVWVALYDSVRVLDQAEGREFVAGPGSEVEAAPPKTSPCVQPVKPGPLAAGAATSNFDRHNYIDAVETIKELIRSGETYQVNLTQKLGFEFARGCAATDLYARLRRDNPARYSAYIDRGTSQVVSTSPESFFRTRGRRIETSPIKGTIRRGSDETEDRMLRETLLTSPKDRAENTMIVDLLRNDLGRVCEYGSVTVERLCEIERHPTLFHLVSTVSGKLKERAGIAEILKALFPCGSITGAPKPRTMELIDDLERAPRGLSMGAIGYSVPVGFSEHLEPGLEVAVAIRTVVVRDGHAEFNVGGGVVIDSDPEAEYKESLLKAAAILRAAGIDRIEPAARRI
ncbi:MAG: aminodeoxychorismate synthase component I [Pyrinomonadaceae bacterium]